MENALQKLASILQKLRTVIERFYNPAAGVAPVVANMTMRAGVSTAVLMRLLWVDANPGVKYDKTNPTHLDGLKFIFNLNNRDWRKDPMFIALGLTS